MREQGSDHKAGTSDVDKFLIENEIFDGNEDEILQRQISLAELAKSKSRIDRDNEEL